MPQTVETKDDVLRLLRDSRDELRRLGVRRVGLFGSFARGDQRATSDVDILVEFEAGRKTFDSFIAVSFLLEEVFGRRVEVVTPESLSPYIAPHILRDIVYVSVAA